MKNSNITKKALLSSVLSLFVCFAMLLGTTFAWFTDSVTSKNNIIQSGTLDVEMYYADGSKAADDTADWKNAAEGAIFNHKLWEPGYVDAKHIKISNVGTLALNYKLRIVANGTVSKLADVIDVYYFATAKQLTRADVETGTYVGTLAQVLKVSHTDVDINGDGTIDDNDKTLTQVVNGMLEAKASETITIALKMKESAGNEYQNLSIGTDFSVELIATQASFESDAFGKDYDDTVVVPSPEIPSALVTSLEGNELVISATRGIGGPVETMTLNAGYQFEPTISFEDVLNSEYKHWHPDFFVYADRDVPSNSIALAGYYKAWCETLNNDNWVALVNDGHPVSAGEENGIRLVNDLACVTYKYICEYGNDGIGFRCGIGAFDAAALAGTTVTVEFRLYETEGEWSDSSHTCQEVASGNYITLGTFTYTFPYPTSTPVTVNNDAELAEAIANGEKDIKLANGTYHMPAVAQGKVFTVSSVSGNAADAIIEVVPAGQGEAGGQLDYSLDGSNVCFNNVTIKTNSQLYAGFCRLEATYNNCIIQNTFNLAYGKAVFNECVINITNEYLRVNGASKAEFIGCTFNTDGRAILVFQDGSNVAQEVLVKDCTFNATAAAQTWNGIHVAAVSYDGSQGGTYTVTFEGNNVVDDDFNGLWQVKAGEANVTVNGLN